MGSARFRVANAPMVDAGYYVEVTSSQLTGGPIGIVPECKHPGFCLQPSGLQRTNPVWRPDSFQFADQPGVSPRGGLGCKDLA